MDSFYGGKQGLSFVLRGRFKYIDKNDPHCPYILGQNGKWTDEDGQEISESQIKQEIMAEAFMDPDYKEVWYGEHAIIDTANKNNRNNGKVYRRTLKNMGDEEIDGWCAEYVGQIVGPSGLPPKLYISNVIDVENKFDGLKPTARDAELFAFVDENNAPKETTSYPDDKAYDLYVFDGFEGEQPFFKDPTPEDGIPENANESMEYNWYVFRTSDDEASLDSETGDYTTNPTEAAIGFNIPYWKADLTSEPYDYNKIPEAADASSPKGFYHKVTFKIPRGIQGAGIENLKSIQFKDLFDEEDEEIWNKIWDFTNENTQIIYNPPSSQEEGYTLVQGSQEWNGLANYDSETMAENSAWFYEFVWYTVKETNGSNESGQTNDGIRWKRISGADQIGKYYAIFENKLLGYIGPDGRIKKLRINPTQGTITVVLSDGSETVVEGNLQLPRQMEVNEDGTITVKTTDNNYSYKFTKANSNPVEDFHLLTITKTAITEAYEETIIPPGADDSQAQTIQIEPYHLLIQFNNNDAAEVFYKGNACPKIQYKEEEWYDCGQMRYLDKANLPVSGMFNPSGGTKPVYESVEDAIEALNEEWSNGVVPEFVLREGEEGWDLDPSSTINHIIAVRIKDPESEIGEEVNFFAYNFLYPEPGNPMPHGWNHVGKISQPLLSISWHKTDSSSLAPVLQGKNIGKIIFTKD